MLIPLERAGSWSSKMEWWLLLRKVLLVLLFLLPRVKRPLWAISLAEGEQCEAGVVVVVEGEERVGEDVAVGEGEGEEEEEAEAEDDVEMEWMAMVGYRFVLLLLLLIVAVCQHKQRGSEGKKGWR
jgi:uncharacterized integral membrane protein